MVKPESSERFNVVIPHYLETVQYTNTRKPVYWKMTDKLPKYIHDGLISGKYKWGPKNGKTVLFENIIAVVKNSKSVNKPRMLSINAQHFWTGGNESEWKRLKIKENLMAQFVPYIGRQLPLKLYAPKDQFIHFEYIFYYPFGENFKMYQDYINHYFVRAKIFEDVLVDMKVIDDDNPGIVRGGYGRYVAITNPDERRMEIKIHFLKNEERIC
jgi:hypothetical protein